VAGSHTERERLRAPAAREELLLGDATRKTLSL